jgi:Domain of unknown function (DUF4878)
MKKIITLLTMAILLFACTEKPGESPKSTLKAAFVAMQEGKLEEIKKYASKQDLQFLSMFEFAEKVANSKIEQFGKDVLINKFKEKVKNVSYDFKNEKIEADNATIDVDIIEKDKKDTHTVNLLKEDGKWKVAFSKTAYFDLGLNDKLNGLDKLMDLKNIINGEKEKINP